MTQPAPIKEPHNDDKRIVTRIWVRWYQDIKAAVSTIVTSFLGLSDTPSSYTGDANKTVRVNNSETSLEFVANEDLGLDHNDDLATLQGGNGSDEYYHLTNADHTEAVAFLDGGTGTHTSYDTHVANTTIHNPYSGIVTVEYDEIVPTFTGNLETSRVYKLATSTVLTLTFTYDTSDRIATVSNGTNTWTYTHAGTGFLSGGVKT